MQKIFKQIGFVSLFIMVLGFSAIIFPSISDNSNDMQNNTPIAQGFPELPINLGSAINYVLLAKTGISTTGTTNIVGNLGVSPNNAASITGFGLTMDVSNEFSTSSLVIGNIYAADYTPPTPTILTTAISDMETAFVETAGRTIPDGINLGDGAGEIGGLTFVAGLYKWTTDVLISTDITISGSATDIFIFQCAQKIDIAATIKVNLIGGAQPKNIFWQASGQITLGTTSVMKGVLLGQTAIVLNTGATLVGRALAQSAITCDANLVSIPVDAPLLTLSTPILNVITPNPDLDGNIFLEWNNVASAVSYNVYRYSSPITTINIANATKIGNGILASQYEDLARPDGVYWYSVKAINGTFSSELSNSLSVEVIIPAEITKPNAPILYTITPNPDIDGNIYLNWSDVVGATTYNVYRYTSTINSGNLLLANNTAHGLLQSEYIDLRLGDGTWYYVVQAENSSGVSLISNVKSVLVAIKEIGGALAPEIPILNAIEPNISSDGDIFLNWSDSEGVISYVVLRYSEPITTENILDADIIVNGLVESQYTALDQPEGTWFYAVQAENSTGISDLSNSESVEIKTDESTIWIWILILAIAVIVIGFIYYSVARTPSDRNKIVKITDRIGEREYNIKDFT